MAVGSYDHVIEIWEITSCPPRFKNSLRQHSGAISALGFSPDGSTLASADQDGAVILWDYQVGQPLGPPLSGHAHAVTALTFTRDGTLISGDKQTLWRWDPRAFTGPRLACARANRNLSMGEWRRYLAERPYCRICAALPAGEAAPVNAPPCAE
jgi:WD40 repeat protein